MTLKSCLASILLLFLFFSFSAFLFPTNTYAQNDVSIADQLNTIYCERRNGDQLNLETWYGGRCETDNLEETIGFGDIILIDLYSRIANDPNSNYYNILKDFLEGSFKAGSLPSIDQLAQGSPGALQAVSYGISKIYQTPPASSVEYIANIRSNFNKHQPVQPVYAQGTGFGFTALDPIIDVWRAFRNLAYLVFILAFIYYGFMIMFRMKINPQTVMNIQTALPKLIITLLLITFSYAIAGLLIDIFYIVVGFLFSVLSASEIVSSVAQAQRWAGYSGGLIVPFLLTLGHIIFGGLTQKVVSAIVYIPPFLGGALTENVIGAGLSLLIGIILIIALLYTYIKVFWMLLKSYVTILLQIIFSPIILLGNVLPGSQAFTTWLRTILAELSVFGVTMLLFVLAFYFIGPWKIVTVIQGITDPGSWDIPFIGPLNPKENQLWAPPPLVSDDSTENAEDKLALLGLGLMLITPSIAKSVREALKVKEFGYGSTLGQALTYGWWPLARESTLGYGKRAVYGQVSNRAGAGGGFWGAAKDVLQQRRWGT